MGDYINEVKTENHSNLPFSFLNKNMKYVSLVGFFFSFLHVFYSF